MRTKSEFFTIRYGAIQGCYWASYCAFFSYAAVFMQDKGFTNSAIGIIFAIANVCAVIMQPVVASIIDKSEKVTIRESITVLAAIMSFVALLMCFLSSIIWIVPILFIIMYTLIQTIQPLNSSLGMECEQFGNRFNFGLARGMGSWSYAVISMLLGVYLLHYEIRTLPCIYFVIFVLESIAVATFIYRDKRTVTGIENNDEISELEEVHSDFISFARCYPKFIGLLMGVVMIFFTHTIINNFTINMIENVHGNSADMGMALGIAAFFELPAMALFATIRKRTGVSKILIFSAIMFSVKHTLILVAPNVTILLAVHVLQMFAFALFLPASIYYVNEIMQKSDAVKGQAYVTMAITLSGIFSSLIGGKVIDAFGFGTLMLIGTIVSAIGSVVVIFSTDKID